jgi:hypothetical protein
MQNSGGEYCFRKIRELIEKAVLKHSNPSERTFIPEGIKVMSLNKTRCNRRANSYYHGTLLNLLEEKRYNITSLADPDEYDENRKYIDNRNKYVHPDEKLSSEAALLELDDIKKCTNERLNWLIRATEPQK